MKAYRYFNTGGQVKEYRTAAARVSASAASSREVRQSTTRCISNEELAVDDFVLIQIPTGSLVIGVILGAIDEVDDAIKYRVLQKIDLAAYDERVAREKRVEELKKELNVLSERFTQIERYELIAKFDPSVRGKVDELKQLLGLTDLATES